MKPWQRVAAALAAALLLWFGAPRVLRHLGFFRVRQIELVGLRYLAPETVLDALHIAPRASVFDETAALTARVRALRGVADARVVRRLPGALRVIVREVEPLALVPGPGGRALEVVDANGQALPYDPSRVTLDLPIVASADSGLVSVLALVRSVNPTLFEEITTARVGRGGGGGEGGVVLELTKRRVLVARDVRPEVIRAVVLVSQDLVARSRAYTELDARYAGQIVVRRATRGGA